MKKEELKLLLNNATDEVSKQILAEAIQKMEINFKKRVKKENKIKKELEKTLRIRRTKFYNWLKIKSEENKKNPTESELKVKALLKSLNITYQFQKIFMNDINGYIPDFFLPCYNIVIEVDGKHHYTPKGIDKDTNRTKDLLRHSKIKGVLRLTNKKVETLTSNHLKELIINYKEPIENLPKINLPKEKNKSSIFDLVPQQVNKMTPRGKRNYLKRKGTNL